MDDLNATEGGLLDSHGKLKIYRGKPEPLGAIVRNGGVNFAIFSKHSTSCSLVLFKAGEDKPFDEIHLSPCYNRTGDIWHVYVNGLGVGIRYGYRMDRHPDNDMKLHRFNNYVILIDPYAKALTGGNQWNILYKRKGDARDPKATNIRRSLVIDSSFDWGDDKPLNIPLNESIIYELHVRGFTCHNTSGVEYPGTFAGLIEKIPYLQDLGVTAVELLPINEFEEMDTDRINPVTGEKLTNYWGYQPISFFAPKASYAANGFHGNQVREFKEMVKAMHRAGIEVILDVVFNHTSEGNELGPTLCYRGIDNSVYYIIDGDSGSYHNYSGCGNTVNCNHPVVRNMILDCLRYWVMEMHVDGFRFDLASILGRGRDGSVLSNPPVLERIAADPVLANTKLIAEAWDAAGLYQVGHFPDEWKRWAEWNGKFRDDVRRFIKSDLGVIPALAKRLAGSPDLYLKAGREPFHSINFITCHDGFTLADLVSYNEKHNEQNGEGNIDGDNNNLSWNCGCEGYTDEPEINAIRSRQIKNFAVILMLSNGVPMILAGDEMGRSQRGNNNAYCQDNDISWIDWQLLEKHRDLHRFFKLIIKFRKKHQALKPLTFELNDTNVWPTKWNGIKPGEPDWSNNARTLAIYLCGKKVDNDIYLIANSYWETVKFRLPKPLNGKKWYRFIDTQLEPFKEITDIYKEEPLKSPLSYTAGARSTVVLITK